jgi:hypothetical protein|tara:strand:- start:531 stop:1148 length:618 start_codon:yes stop_codon:yes gene_type:complete
MTDEDIKGISVEWFMGDYGDSGDYFRPPHDIDPRQFQPDKARIVLEYMMIGLTDRQSCALIPLDVRFWNSWRRGSRDTPSSFVRAYAKASDLQIASMGEMVIDISDGTDTTTASLLEDSLRNIDNPYAEGMNKQFERVVKGILQTNANRINARKWYVGKRLPGIYGDKIQLEHQGGTKPVEVDFKSLSTEQLEMLAQLEQSLDKE